ncbi:T9SS type B sorting domain-containing protein [Aquimarina sp. D1M17]|uniref:T9SS type B sorting domain-containing protein n=1 Tax=Aquimarina acroporae TaxID=2937283 RepID=UPI0020C177D8|nr:T9SS type B sorting domain-containing protein [Aquimarina acroporae]MCK8521835.1 T9SS type B sorting domain-containing protein [Aquimarina acroporae]
MAKKISFSQILLVLFFIGSSTFSSFAQLDFDVACRTAQPFCSDAAQELTFPNITGEDISFQGLGCLDSTRNSSWYFLRIDEPGELIFDIQQWIDINDNSNLDRGEQQLDVDFIAWGPFTTSFINCEDQLTQGCDLNGDGENIRPAECVNNVDDPDFYVQNLDNTNIVDCSFARNPDEGIFTETFTIPDAQTGEYYFILITNFSDEAGVIQLQQTNLDEDNAGTTDCTILEPGVGPDIATCGEFPVTIEGRFPGAITYQWRTWALGADSSSAVNIGGLTDTPVLDVNTPGVYELIGFSDTGGSVEVGRDDLSVVDVSVIEIAVTGNVAEESFSGSYTITAEITTTPIDIQALGFTDFEYRLDRDIGNGFQEYREYQSSPVFTDVPPGDYRVLARYRNCPVSERESEIIMILGYPKYFTPNGDGFHDTWSLINIENQPTALIYIFDRYGKLLKQLRPGGAGWDGTYNGRNMPSSDYWFRVEFNEPTDPNMRRRVVAGSFSLIR